MPGASSQMDMMNKESCNAVVKAMQNDGIIFMIASKPESITVPEFYHIGVIIKIKQIVKMPDKTMRVLIDVLKRAELLDYGKEQLSSPANAEYFTCNIIPIEETDTEQNLETETWLRMLKDNLTKCYSGGVGSRNKLVFRQLMSMEEPGPLADGTAEFLNLPYTKKQQLLETTDIKERVILLLKFMEEEMEIFEIRNDIKEKLKECVNRHQREYVLREQLKVIKKELGEDDSENMSEEYEKKLAELDAPDEVREKLAKELSRYKNMNPAMAESSVISNYMDVLLEYPWNKQSKENTNLKKAIKILENDHYGLSEVKERIIDYLAVRILTGKGNMPVICLVGPPGTGKTSIAKSIAKATNREYARMSLGGVRDEAEIRGHRKTYVGAMPGRLVQLISNTKTNNPLILLDEIDKVSSDYKGDVSSALLEVLDSEQNMKFHDHYFEVSVDFSNVLFVATANDVSTIPGPLLDRMEVIEISGYTANEKFHIAKLYLLDKARRNNGLTKTNFRINDEAIRDIIRYYTREAGVRGLERNIDKLCRKACRMLLTKDTETVKINRSNLPEFLGTEKYRDEDTDLSDKTGIVRGLAWTAAGGVTLDIEVNIMPGSGNIQLTGKLGDVMKESAVTGLSFIRSLDEAGDLGDDYFEKHDIHIHIPEGAVPKDGPSAGITMATALYSAIFGRQVHGNLAMTGEITLRGQVLAIGGLKEKMLAAKTIGITNIIVPDMNKKDVADLDSEITDGLDIIYVDNMNQVLSRALV